MAKCKQVSGTNFNKGTLRLLFLFGYQAFLQNTGQGRRVLQRYNLLLNEYYARTDEFLRTTRRNL